MCKNAFMKYPSWRHWLAIYFAGVGLLFPVLACSVAIKEAFSDPKETMRYMAFTVSGGGLGFIVMPYICELILERYGWKGTFVILSGIFSNTLVAAMGYVFYLPPRKPSTETQQRNRKTDTSVNFSVFKNPMYITFLIVVVPYGLTGTYTT